MRTLNRLTAIQVARTKKPGVYSDGGGLYLQVTSNLVKSWLFLYMLHGRARGMGLSPPHLAHKWRRKIQETVAGAKVWILNGPDTLVKLLNLREQLGMPAQGQEFFILGRVRMRMGFHWRPRSSADALCTVR